MIQENKAIDSKDVILTIKLTMDELNTALESLDFFIREGLEQPDSLRVEDIKESKIYKLRENVSDMLIKAWDFKDLQNQEEDKVNTKKEYINKIKGDMSGGVQNASW